MITNHHKIEEVIHLNKVFRFVYIPRIDDRNGKRLLVPVTYLNIQDIQNIREGGEPEFCREKKNNFYTAVFFDANKQDPLLKHFLGERLELEGSVRIKLENEIVRHAIFAPANWGIIQKLYYSAKM